MNTRLSKKCKDFDEGYKGFVLLLKLTAMKMMIKRMTLIKRFMTKIAQNYLWEALIIIY